MKKMKQVCLFMILLACTFLPTAAFAAGDGIGVQLDGKNLNFTDASPIMEDNRVYVPFRTVFEALGATVGYDKATDAIHAQKDNTSVQFEIGKTDITVNDKTVTTDAASIVRDGRTYVPVRFAAQALGVTVGWDKNTQTVVMVNKDAIKEELKGQYTLMDQYMKYSEKFNKEPMSIKGTLKFDMNIADGSGTDATMMPINGTFKIDGISSAEAASIKMAANLNLDDLKAALEKADQWTEEDTAMAEKMKTFDMDIIMDMANGKIYFKTALLDLADLDGNAWYMMDLNTLLASTGMDFKALMEGATSGSYEQYMYTMLDALPITDANGTKVLLQTLLQYQDKSFEKSGNNYVSTLKEEANGAATTLHMTLKTDGSNKVVGYTQDMDMYMGTTPLMTMKVDQTDNKATIQMNMDMAGVMTMNLSGDLVYSATNEKPQTAPASGETVIDLMKELNSAA